MHSQLNDAFTLYKTEKAENDRMLNETNDKLQKQLTELQSSHAKCPAELEFVNKRLVRLQVPCKSRCVRNLSGNEIDLNAQFEMDGMTVGIEKDLCIQF